MSVVIYECKEYDQYEFNSIRYMRTEGEYEPNVYVVEECETGIRYIGSRTAYKHTKAKDDDIGRNYFTSSSVVKEKWKRDINSFSLVYVIPCMSNHDAHLLELILIKENDAVRSQDYYNIGHPYIGFNTSGRSHSEKERDKIRNGVITYYTSDEGRDRMKYHSGHISNLHKSGHYDEAYKKISNANKGMKKPEGFGDKVSKSRKGWCPSEKTRKKMSEVKMGKNTGKDNAMNNEDSRNKVGKSKIGRKRVYLSSGKFIYAKEEDVHKYYLHSNGKYYDYEE